MNYFSRPEVSNSDLTALARNYNALPDNRAELEDIFNFGSLVDGMLTEDWRVNPLRLTLRQDYGDDLVYEADVFLQADLLARSCKRDPVISSIIKQMVGQYVFIRTLGFSYEGEELEIRARCKFDEYGKSLSMGADFKTTSCASRKQFREAISFFHWDRQAAFYMDLAKIDRQWIIGISKKTGEIFKHAIQRGDETYLAGRAKYSFWAYRWKLLIEPFNVAA